MPEARQWHHVVSHVLTHKHDIVSKACKHAMGWQTKSSWGTQGDYLGKKIPHRSQSSLNSVTLHVHLIWGYVNRYPGKKSAQKCLMLACYALKLSYSHPSISCMATLLLNRRLHYLSASPLPQCGSALCQCRWTPAPTHLSHNFHACQHLHACKSDELRHDSQRHAVSYTE